MFNAYAWAESLYDADWKSNEKEFIMDIYSLDEHEVKEVCELLKEFETSQN